MQMKEKLKEYGSKGESYADILEKVLNAANERAIQQHLLDATKTISIQEALLQVKRKWQK
jgi:hypothetical protein